MLKTPNLRFPLCLTKPPLECCHTQISRRIVFFVLCVCFPQFSSTVSPPLCFERMCRTHDWTNPLIKDQSSHHCFAGCLGSICVCSYFLCSLFSPQLLLYCCLHVMCYVAFKSIFQWRCQLTNLLQTFRTACVTWSKIRVVYWFNLYTGLKCQHESLGKSILSTQWGALALVHMDNVFSIPKQAQSISFRCSLLFTPCIKL